MRLQISDGNQTVWRTIVPVLAVLFPVMCGQAVAEESAEPNQPAPLDCVLEPYEVVEVSSAVQGVIDQIYVDRNDSVRKGQLLVELDSDVEKTQVDLARTRASLNTTIELRETELAFNKRSQQRLEKLYTTDTISLHVKDEADTDTTKSVLQLRNARDSQRLAELELAKARAILELRSMRSPIDGVVVARNKVAGEFVEDQSILRLAQLDPLRVEVIVPVERFGEIEAGMQVEVMPEHFGDGPRMATVTMVDRMIDPASGTFDVRAELPNPDHKIPSGLRCTVQFLDKVIPAASIAETEDTAPEPIATESIASEILTPGPFVSEPAEPVVELVLEELELVSINAERLPGVSVAPRFAATPASLDVPACEAEVPARKQKYAVVADPIANLSTSDELLDELHAQGVSDYYLQRSGKVGLGLFKYKGNAEQRIEDLTLLGFKADMRIVNGAPVQSECTENRQFAVRD